MDEQQLIYDWNVKGPVLPEVHGPVELNDETLRDGLQSASVRDPSDDDKLRLLHLMDRLGIAAVNVGLPGAGPRAVESTGLLVREIREAKLGLKPNCAARTVRRDIEPIVEISQKQGMPIDAYLFLGSSPVRQYVEDWDLDRLLDISGSAIEFAVKEGLPVSFVTEDTTRSDPRTLRPLFLNAIEKGARRLCLCDTVGHAFPSGVRNLVRFVHEVVRESGVEVALDWHGHRDRGLDLINAITALSEGVRRIHGSALGIGERVGNTPMDHLLVNLRLLGVIDNDLSALREYGELVERALGVPRPYNYPIMGDDAFRTATGVHAAAIIKARARGKEWLADVVYSGVPAQWLGRKQDIEVGPMSGASNVRFWLEQHGFAPDDENAVAAILGAAKESDRSLTDEEMTRLVRGATEGGRAEPAGTEKAT